MYFCEWPDLRTDQEAACLDICGIKKLCGHKGGRLVHEGTSLYALARESSCGQLSCTCFDPPDDAGGFHISWQIQQTHKSGRKGSNLYEINQWLWQFGRGKSRLGGLSVAETKEWHITVAKDGPSAKRAVSTRAQRCHKAPKAAGAQG